MTPHARARKTSGHIQRRSLLHERCTRIHIRWYWSNANASAEMAQKHCANQRYYRSFTVYGQVKLQEARNATAFLGPGRITPLLLRPGRFSQTVQLTHRTRTLRMHIPTQPPCLANFFKCEHNFNQPSLEVHRKDMEHAPNHTGLSQDSSEEQRMSSSFDAGAVTHQELHTRSMVKIESLKVESRALDGQRLLQQGTCEAELILNGEVAIWQKSIKQLTVTAWRKWSMTGKHSMKRLGKVLFSDRHGVGANNKRFTWRLVFSMWRSTASLASSKRMAPEISRVSDLSIALERLMVKDEQEAAHLHSKVRKYSKDLEKILSKIRAKERQLAMVMSQLERLRATAEPMRQTMELFSKYARLCWNQYADTILNIMHWAHTDLQAHLRTGRS